MNKVSFYLARPKGKSRTVIHARMKVGGGQVRFGTGLSVLPKQWSARTQRVKGSAIGAAPMNDRLERITLDLKSVVIELMNSGVHPTPERVQSRYDALTSVDATRSGEKGFLDYVQDWKEESKGKVTSSTLSVYGSALRHLQAFSEARGRTLTFEGMDQSFVNEFTRYLSTVVGLQDASIEKYRKTWKTFMKWSLDRGLTTNDYFLSVPKLKPAERLSHRLTLTELDRLATVDLTNEPSLANARDLFVLQCWTGQRFGDLMRIMDDPSAFRRGDVWELSAEKTGKTNRVPLLPEALRILDGENPPHPITNQRMNEYMKDAARRAGLDRPVRTSQERGRERTEKTQPLHEVLTTHDAKRTFVSVMTEKGISREIIRAITGNTDKTLSRYLHLDEAAVRGEFMRAFDVKV